MTRQFRATPATRKAVPLLIGIAGPPGAGKTYSALVIAEGIRAHRGGPVIMIDTERNRSLAYAPPAGVAADGVNHFDFMHVPFTPPFSSLDFLEAVMQQREHKPSCIVIDSFSDEHEGDGGMLDFHDKELDRMAGDDWSKRERVGQAAWIKPKAKRLEMMNGLFQVMTPLIFCFRAREKTKQIANDKGKQVPTNIGWTPIAPPEIVHNMSLFALLPVKSDGVPMWKGNTAYEDFSIKLPRQFAGMFPEGKRIDSKMGQAMSIWALGDQKIERSDPKSAKPAASPAKTADPAGPASTAGTATGAGTPATGDDTGQREAADGRSPAQRQLDINAAERANEDAPGPQGDAAAQNAEPASGTKDSATAASGSSAEATSSPRQGELLIGDGSAPDEGFLGDTAPTEATEQSDDPAPEDEPEPAVDVALADFADAIADANDWAQINAAVLALSRTDWWTNADYISRERCRAAQYHRLVALREKGYALDHVMNMTAYRAYIAYETDLDALKGTRSAAASLGNPAWNALDTKAKTACDNAFAARVKWLQEHAGQEEFV